MTLSLLPRPAPAGAPWLSELRAARSALDQAASLDESMLDSHELGGVIAMLSELESATQSLRLRLSTAADMRRMADETADTGTDAWLARLTGTTREAMAGGLWLAGRLETTYAASREAFAAGRLRVEQVRVIVHAADQAPPEATPEQVRMAEELLVSKATGDGTRSGRPMDARRLRQVARRMFDIVDRDLADRHEQILLGREARTAEESTYFALHDNGDGSWSGRFRIPELHGQLFRQAIDRLTAPRRLSRDRDGAPVVDVSAPGTGWGANLDETRGAALLELIEHLPTQGHAASAVDVLVKIDLEALLTGLGAAGLDTGVAITAGDARRLACESGLVPAVLGGSSQPLDLGRSRRLHDLTQRRALALLHDSCAIAGCARPFAWCEIHHHRLSWSRGGRTDLDNGLPLCGHHHRRAHDTRFDLRRRTDGEWAFHRRT